jgi:hypothetical protein
MSDTTSGALVTPPLVPSSGRVAPQYPRLAWVGLVLERHPWYVGAAWLFGLQVALSAVSRVVDALWFPVTSQGFFAAMLLFAVLVGMDALQAGMGARRAALWATIVTLGWIFGAVPYARRRARR